MTDLQALLDVQRIDNELDQLRYRHENLPERAELAGIADEEQKLAAARAKTEEARAELGRRERDRETEAADMEEKAKKLEARLYDGSVTSPKEATALGDEIAGMKERQSHLEDQAIEMMLEMEPLDAQIQAAQSEADRFAARRAELEKSLASGEAELDAEIDKAEAARAAEAAKVDGERLEQYRKMRITYGPDAVVEFDAARGGGCPVAMSAVELDRWKHLPAGSVGPCADCGRFVVKLS